MADNVIDLDQVNTSANYNFHSVYSDKNIDDELELSSLNFIESNCKYFLPCEVRENINFHSPRTIQDLSIFSFNIRSLTGHWDAFTQLLYDMSDNNKFYFDIIGLSEIFNIPGNLPPKLPGYHPFEYKTRTDCIKGGVGLYIKDSLKYKPRDDLTIFIPHVIETVFIEIDLGNHKNVITGIIYRPNTQPLADVDFFISRITEVIQSLNNSNSQFIIMGDFNIDMLKYGSHAKTTDFVDTIISEGTLPLITKPTRITEHSATLIDHIHTNIVGKHISSGIVLTDISDHLGTFCVVHKMTKTNLSSPKYVQIQNHENIEQFKVNLQSQNFSDTFDCTSTEIAYKKFTDLYQTLHDASFPLKKVQIKSKYVKKAPWMTNGLLNSSLQKCKLFKTKLRRPSQQNINHYNSYLKTFNKLCRLAKKLYYDNILQQYHGNIKQTWKILNEVIHKSNSGKPFPRDFLVNGKLSSNPQEIVNGFNDYFTSIGQSISENIDVPHTDFSRHMSDRHAKSFFMEPVTPEELITIAKSLKAKSSKGHDNISTKLLKETIHLIAGPLSHIFNLSFGNGIVPSDMKIARVIPIFKSGDHQLFNNYRPISILPSFSKLLEKIMYKRLYRFLQDGNIFYKHQYGFRRKHSTVHPITHFIKFITTQNDKTTKDITVAIFLDLQKAFDTVSHDILLKKLHFYGVRGLGYNWFKSYISDRFQYSEILGSKSVQKPISHGVPQDRGLHLGPTAVFNLYQ